MKCREFAVRETAFVIAGQEFDERQRTLDLAMREVEGWDRLLHYCERAAG